MKKLKNLLFLSLSTTILLTTPILANETTNNSSEDYFKEISSGTYAGTGMNETHTLQKEDGKKVNFYVENNGSQPIVIKISNISERLLKPGEKGHIYVNINKKSSEFKFSTTTNGGDININYIIRQRNT